MAAGGKAQLCLVGLLTDPIRRPASIIHPGIEGFRKYSTHVDVKIIPLFSAVGKFSRGYLDQRHCKAVHE